MGKPLPDLGILFRGDMVRAILAGEKRVTRRAMKPPKAVDGDPWRAVGPFVRDADDLNNMWFEWARGWADSIGGSPWVRERSRYGPPGRLLWVRETWVPLNRDYRPAPRGTPLPANGEGVIPAYRADHLDPRGDGPDRIVWRPSLLMPRWASRITLRVTDVRAERLTAITAADVALEGFAHAGLGDTPADYCRGYREMHGLAEDADPWVWRVGFERVGVSGG